MHEAALVLFWFAFALYIGATVLYAYQFVLRRQKVAWWARFLTGAGFLCQTASVAANSMATKGTSYTGANQLVLVAWALVLVYFIVEHVLRIRAYGAFLIPVAVVLMIVSQLLGLGAANYASPDNIQLQGFVTAFHVALIVFGNVGFAFGSISAALYLYQNSLLKRRKTSKISRRLPSLATLQNVARRSIALAYPIYTAGLTFGIIRAIQTDVSGWWSDPRVMMAGLVWLTYGAYLGIVYRRNMSSREASWIAVVGFVLVIVTAIVARTLPVGFHTFGIG